MPPTINPRENNLPLFNIMEEMSIAHIHALASSLGFACERVGKDFNSVDLKLIGDGYPPSNMFVTPELGLQMKATTDLNSNNGHFPFSLEIKNYNDLRKRQPYPKLLVVYKMPSNSLNWLHHRESGLFTRHCAYWLSLYGLPEVSNTSNRTVYIPCKNVLTPYALKDLMLLSSKYGEIKHGV